jgi:hypothetical protein
MEMNKDALEYLVSLGSLAIKEVNGQTYSDRILYPVKPYVPTPEKINITSLDSVVKLVKAEAEKLMSHDGTPVFVRVDTPRKVSVFSGCADEFKRHYFYEATCDVPDFYEGFRSHEKAIIELQSQYAEGEGREYLLGLLSSISKESNVSTNDNGVSQTVQARSGVSLLQTVPVKPRVSLRPYRTFLEVEQPESQFLLRLNDKGEVGLFEADGGMWKMQAKKNVCTYLESGLSELVSAGSVVVME